MARPAGFQQQDSAFPIYRPSFKPLRKGLQYGMTITRRDGDAPDLPMPIRSSLFGKEIVTRFQLSRNIRLLRNYGFAPGNPVLKAQSIPVQALLLQQRPTPTMTRFGMQKPSPGATPVFPRTGARGGMGSVRRFPKAIRVVPNTYRPPVYGQDTPQVQEE